jgi:starvation-inducible DNA-binding protein
VENATPNLVTQFTSRGPSIDYAIKPEVVAVGQGIYTATESLDPGGDLYDPTGYTVVQGSSFAAAMVGGAAALVKQANPGFSAAQIKSAIVNTASIGPSDISDSTQSTSNLPLVTAVGAGKLNAPAALAPGATAAPATISFGWMGPGSPASTVPLTITNTGKATATFKISVVPDPAARSARRRRRWRRRLGPHFRDYHLLLDEQGDQLFAMTDPIAERIRKIGGTTLRSIGHIARLQRVSDNDAEYVEPEDMLAELREDKKSLAARLREAHGVCEEHTDVATASLIEVWIDETERFACYRGNAVPVNSVLGLRNSSRAGRHYCGWSKCGAYQRPEHYSGRSKCGRPASTLRLAQFSGRVNMPIGA